MSPVLLSHLRRCLPLLVLVLQPWLAQIACAQSGFEIVLVLSQQEGQHQLFAQGFRRGVSRLGHLLRVAGGGELDPDALERADLIVTSGEAALEAVLALPPRPTLAVMLGRQAFERLQASVPARPLSALTLDQPAQRQLRLFKALLPEARRIGLLHQTQAAELEALRTAAQACGLELQIEQLEESGQLLKQLDALLRSSDGLLLLPEAAVSAPTAVRSILLTSYRYRKPVLAFSRAYVDAGALAAVFSTPEQIAAEVLDWLGRQTEGTLNLPVVAAPVGFELAVNRQVGRSLGIEVAAEEDLIRAVAVGACS